MSADAQQLKPDGRSPQQLAQAILEHEFSPEVGSFERVSFGEQLAFNADQHGHPAQVLLSPLNTLATGGQLSPFAKQCLSHAQEVVAAYQANSTADRDRYAMHANPDLRPRNEAQAEARQVHVRYGRPDSDAQREAQEDMATSIVELGNLRSIEKLLHTLARHPDVNVRLIEPRRPGGRG